MSVEFFVIGSSIGVDTNGIDGWSVPWDSRTLADGPVALMAIATDSDRQTATSSVSVTVSNPPAPTTMHVVDLDGFSTTQGSTKHEYRSCGRSRQNASSANHREGSRFIELNNKLIVVVG